jgi:hypothetical protein
MAYKNLIHQNVCIQGPNGCDGCLAVTCSVDAPYINSINGEIAITGGTLKISDGTCFYKLPSSPGTSGCVLASAGNDAALTWASPGGVGGACISASCCIDAPYINSLAGGIQITCGTLTINNADGCWYELPDSPGTSGYVLTSCGPNGSAAWAEPTGGIGGLPTCNDPLNGCCLSVWTDVGNSIYYTLPTTISACCAQVMVSTTNGPMAWCDYVSGAGGIGVAMTACSLTICDCNSHYTLPETPTACCGCVMVTNGCSGFDWCTWTPINCTSPLVACCLTIYYGSACYSLPVGPPSCDGQTMVSCMGGLNWETPSGAGQPSNGCPGYIQRAAATGCFCGDANLCFDSAFCTLYSAGSVCTSYVCANCFYICGCCGGSSYFQDCSGNYHCVCNGIFIC